MPEVLHHIQMRRLPQATALPTIMVTAVQDMLISPLRFPLVLDANSDSGPFFGCKLPVFGRQIVCPHLHQLPALFEEV